MDDEKFESWAIVEVMGHRVFAGLVSEQEIAGAGFIRVDVPEADGAAAFTKLFSPSSIYAVTPCTEDTARQAAKAHRSRPVEIYQLPAAVVVNRNDLDDAPELF